MRPSQRVLERWSRGRIQNRRPWLRRARDLEGKRLHAAGGSGARGTGRQVLGTAEGYDSTLRAGGGNIERLAGEPLRVYWLAVRRSEGTLGALVASCDLQIMIFFLSSAAAALWMSADSD